MEFSKAFVLIPLMEFLVMHNDAVRFLRGLVKSIDVDIRERRFLYDFFNKGMLFLSKTMHRSISKHDPIS